MQQWYADKWTNMVQSHPPPKVWLNCGPQSSVISYWCVIKRVAGEYLGVFHELFLQEFFICFIFSFWLPHGNLITATAVNRSATASTLMRWGWLFLDSYGFMNNMWEIEQYPIRFLLPFSFLLKNKHVSDVYPFFCNLFPCKNLGDHLQRTHRICTDIRS